MAHHQKLSVLAEMVVHVIPSTNSSLVVAISLPTTYRVCMMPAVGPRGARRRGRAHVGQVRTAGAAGGGTTHGYQLKTAFERRTGGSWALNIGQVYTTLQRLERDSLVEAADAGDDHNDYRITDAGRTQLDAWFATPVVPEGPAATS